MRRRRRNSKQSSLWCGGKWPRGEVANTGVCKTPIRGCKSRRGLTEQNASAFCVGICKPELVSRRSARREAGSRPSLSDDEARVVTKSRRGLCSGGGIGLRATLKMLWPQGRVGSSPTPSIHTKTRQRGGFLCWINYLLIGSITITSVCRV